MGTCKLRGLAYTHCDVINGWRAGKSPSRSMGYRKASHRVECALQSGASCTVYGVFFLLPPTELHLRVSIAGVMQMRVYGRAYLHAYLRA